MIIKKIKNSLYTSKEWLKRMYVYPRDRIIPGDHFNYDEYWKEKRGEKYIGSLGSWQKKRAEIASSIISKSNGVSINDIGSGAGEVLLYIKNHTLIKQATCYDSSTYALDIAKSLGLETKKFDLNNKGDYSKIQLADFTIMFEVLEHVPGSEELLKFAYDSSRKGVLFSFPNTGFFIHRFRLFFFGKFPMQWARHPAEHLRFWTKRDLLWWLKAQGYENYKVRYYVGVPVLKNIWPNMFAAGFFVEIIKN
ncbi:MAG: class I SAM-dependent methyltransferase [Patescibacteria group bacterium]